MGSVMEIGVKAKKFAILSIKMSYRSVCHHPFLVGMVLFLIFLYRSFPFLFSLLVSASPVLVCTAVLLGTLLSFGQPHIPEIEKEEKFSHDIASLRAGVSENGTIVVERDESFVVERYTGDRVVVDKSIEDLSSVDEEVGGKVENDVGLVECVPLIDEDSRGTETEKRVIDEAERNLHGFELEERGIRVEELRVGDGLSDAKAVENQYSLIQEIGDEILATEVDRSLGESVEANKEDQLDSSIPGGRDDGNNNDEDGDDDGSSYSGSDRAESSSPDASMADIIPMLDELHPLLDLEAPQPPHMSHDESDAASEESHGSHAGSIDSDADTENQGDEVEEDGGDDNDEEEEAQGAKEDESKSAIKWTEDDQKNLMDLGTSELERNQRLENLIARRRSRKSFRLLAERNLIDLESADLPFNVAPVLTTRNNPFDAPYDSYENMGLPPIPGSAPSILLPRRNPFDLPYDSSEEKPDLKGDDFEEEFMGFHQKETLFRRHESFSVGAFGFGGSRLGRHDNRWKPVFVPERLASEGTSYPSFERQTSELSESKLSSVPDTESVSSMADTDERKFSEQDFSKEAELISNIYYTSDLVEHRSHFSEHVDPMEMVLPEKRDVQLDKVEIILGEVENHHRRESTLFETEEAATRVEFDTSNTHLVKEPVEEEGSSKSSLSSSSEVDVRISDAKIEDGSVGSQVGRDYNDESGIPAKSSLEESEIQFTSGVVDDNQNKEPVYDSSPTTPEKLLSFSSISSDTQVEMSEIVKPSASVEMSVSVEDRESEVREGRIQKDSMEVHAVDESAVGLGEGTESSEFIDSKASLSGVAPVSDDQNEAMVHESGLVPVSIDSRSFSSDIQSVGEGRIILEKGSPNDCGLTSTLDVEMPAEASQHEDAKLDSVASGDQVSSKDTSTFAGSEELPPPIVEHASVDPELSTSETEPLEKHEVGQEEQPSPVVEHASGDSNLSTLETEPLEKQKVGQEEQPLPIVKQASIDFDLSTSETEPLEKQKVVREEQPSPLVEHVLAEEEIKDTTVHLKMEGQSLSFDSDFLVESSQDSNNLTLSVEETQAPLVVEEVSTGLPSLSSSENDKGEDHTVNNEETIHFERDQLPSSSSDVKVDSSVPEDFDLKVASSTSDDHHGSCEENSSLELEKELSWSDKATVEPIVDDHDNLHEPAIVTTESKQDSSITGDVSDPMDQSSGTSDFASIQSVGLQFKSSAGEVDSKDGIIDGNVEDYRSLLERELEAHVGEENIKEEVDDIKDIDEGLLSELDTVGDFNVTEVGEQLHFELIQEQANVGNPALESLLSASNPMETILELPVFEARSLKDTELAFKNIHTGVDANVGSTAPESLPSASNPAETSPELAVVEARSLEDIDLAFKKLHEGVEASVGSSAIESLASASNPTVTSPDLPVLEARSLEDIELAFKQLHEGVDVEEVILPSVIEQRLVGEEFKSPIESTSDLQVVEANSLDDIRTALKQVSEDNVGKLSKPSDSEDGSAEVGTHEVGSTTKIEPGNVESSIEESGPTAADEPKDGDQETIENSGSIPSEPRGKSSNSSSSSSSSSSDSE